MFDTMIPLNDNILVKRDAQEEKTQGGIYMAAAVEEKNNVGTVIAAGPGKYFGNAEHFVPTQLKVGDKVYFPKYGGVELDEEYVMLREDNIIGIF